MLGGTFHFHSNYNKTFCGPSSVTQGLIVVIKETHVRNSKSRCTSVPQDYLIFANSDEIPHSLTIFHLHLHTHTVCHNHALYKGFYIIKLYMQENIGINSVAFHDFMYIYLIKEVISCK